MPSAPDESVRPRTEHDARRSRLAVVHAFLRFLEAERLGWVLLGRGVERAVEADGDLDIVVEPAQVGELPRLVRRFCQAAGLRCIRVMQHEWNAFNFALAWRESGTGALQVLQIDLCGDYGRSGRRFVPAAELIQDRVRSSRAPDLFVPSPAFGFITYLLKKVDKVQLTPPEMGYLEERWREAAQASMAQLLRFWDAACAQQIGGALEAGDFEALRDALPALRSALHRRIGRSFEDGLREARRLVARALHPVGYWVAFLGPDGSGKSTIAQRVGGELAPLFREVHHYHLRPHWLGRPRSREPVVDPHASPSRGRIASIAKLCLWWLDGNAGFLLDLYPRLVRAELVLFDRHFADLLVDPRRYRYRGSQRLASLFCASTFWPSFFVLLDAPVEVIHARKAEVAPGEVERQRREYRRLLYRFPGSQAVDTTRCIDDVATEITDGILERLERRTADRLGLAPTASALQTANEPSERAGWGRS